jgi:pimeloyl-ACP methyl ester carboxylesterase
VGIRRPARREWLEGIARHRQATRKIRDGGVPIGYVLGEGSNPFFDHIHAKLVVEIPAIRTVRVPGAAHMLPIEAPAAFADAVRQAIESSAR